MLSLLAESSLDTHEVISAKIQTLLDGRWRSLGGRPIHAAVTALSAHYNAVLADHLTRELGVEWERRHRGADRNPQWEIAGVSDEVIAEFSGRTRDIEREKDRLIDQYIAQHGRRPSDKTIVRLRAQATLATRPEKEIHSLSDPSADWRQRASRLVGGDATKWAGSITAGRVAAPLRADEVSLAAVGQIATRVDEAVSEKIATWRHWSLWAEASKQTMGLRFASTEDREAIVGLIVEAAERESIALTPPELAISPVWKRSARRLARNRKVTSTNCCWPTKSGYSSLELTEHVLSKPVPARAGSTHRRRELTAADYSRAEKLLSHNRRELIVGDCLDLRWLSDTTLLYRVTRSYGIDLVHVDITTADRRLLFTFGDLASLLQRETGISADSIDISVWDVRVENATATVLAMGDLWEYDYQNQRLERSDSTPVPGAVMAPDRRHYAIGVEDGNLQIVERETGQVVLRTHDGSDRSAYAVQPDQAREAQLLQRLGVAESPVVLWSPDSRTILTHRIDQSAVPTMPLVRSSPSSHGNPDLIEYHYPLPGGPAPKAEWVLFDIATGEQRVPPLAPFDLPFLSPITQRKVWWSTNSQWIYWLDQPRYSRILRIHRLDHETGKVELLHEEESDRRIDLSPQLAQAPVVWVADDDDTMLLWSQRDGRGHLYRHDLPSGEYYQVSSGEFDVQELFHVDNQSETAVVALTGLVASDPYRRSVARLSLRSGELSLLTPDNLDHQCSVSPDGFHLVDSASTISDPPIVSVLDANGRLVMELEHADCSAMSELGWQPPIRVETTAADGATAIYSALYLPVDFNEANSYPVIDHVYPGPQRTRVASSFHQTYLDQDAEALTALGFVVVAIDGRGTPLRQRDFQDHSYGALWRTSDVDDHVAAITQMAQTRPWMDVSRVGVMGRSGGGYAAARSLMVRPAFFSTGVALAGNHDSTTYQAVWAESYHGPIQNDQVAHLSNVALADQLAGPLLLVHGDLDDNVTFHQSARLASALSILGAPVEFCLVSGAEHCFVGYEHHVAALSWNHLVQHLHGTTPPPYTPSPARRSETRWGHLRTSGLTKGHADAAR